MLRTEKAAKDQAGKNAQIGCCKPKIPNQILKLTICQSHPKKEKKECLLLSRGLRNALASNQIRQVAERRIFQKEETKACLENIYQWSRNVRRGQTRRLDSEQRLLIGTHCTITGLDPIQSSLRTQARKTSGPQSCLHTGSSTLLPYFFHGGALSLSA